MIRTQVYLTQELNRDIQILAQSNNKPKAEVIREALSKGLKIISPRKPNTKKGLLALAELGEKLKIKGPPDLSANIDKYLYEE
ncbi:hypothetical protein HYW46_06795 [Candidatus Daviesbacteria bacterium]|nr:hypothetical protein [Candidatus Daviesbacteria bacterium]